MNVDVNEARQFSLPAHVGLKAQVLQRPQHIVLGVMVSLWEFVFVFLEQLVGYI